MPKKRPDLKRKRKKPREEIGTALDKALEEAFPESDPVAVNTPLASDKDPEKQPGQHLEVVG